MCRFVHILEISQLNIPVVPKVVGHGFANVVAKDTAFDVAHQHRDLHQLIGKAACAAHIGLHDTCQGRSEQCLRQCLVAGIGIFADILEIRRTRYGYEKEEQNCDNIFEMITHGFVV